MYLMHSFALLEAPTDSFLGPLKRKDTGPDGPGWSLLCWMKH